MVGPGLEPDPLHQVPRDCPASTSTSPRVAYRRQYSAQMVALSTVTGQTRPVHPRSARSPSTAARNRRCSAPSSRAAGCRPCDPRGGRIRVSGSRAAAPGAPRPRCATGRARIQDVARREHAELVAQLPRAAAAVEHGDDGVELEPGIAFQTAEETWEPGAATEAADVQFAKPHRAAL